MCKVLNARKVGKRSSATQLYIGRPSKWGNRSSSDATAPAPTSSRNIAPGSSREPALMNALDELRDRDLICWCAPLACHGDVLIELANRR